MLFAKLFPDIYVYFFHGKFAAQVLQSAQEYMLSMISERNLP